MTTALVVPPVGQLISYVEFNTDVTISATTAATANTVVTADAFTPNGVDAYFVEFFAPGVTIGSSVGAQILIDLYDNGSVISSNAQIGQFVNTAAQVFINECYVSSPKLIPTNASHQYSIRAHRVTANGSVNGTGAGATQPGFVKVYKA